MQVLRRYDGMTGRARALWRFCTLCQCICLGRGVIAGAPSVREDHEKKKKQSTCQIAAAIICMACRRQGIHEAQRCKKSEIILKGWLHSRSTWSGLWLPARHLTPALCNWSRQRTSTPSFSRSLSDALCSSCPGCAGANRTHDSDWSETKRHQGKTVVVREH